MVRRKRPGTRERVSRRDMKRKRKERERERVTRKERKGREYR
jgi:hypothetical protein